MRPSDDSTGYPRFSAFGRALSLFLFPLTSVLFFFDIRVSRFACLPSALSRSFAVTIIFLRIIIRGRKINRRRKSRNGRFPGRRGYKFVQLFQQGRNGFGLRSGEFNELVFILEADQSTSRMITVQSYFEYFLYPPNNLASSCPFFRRDIISPDMPPTLPTVSTLSAYSPPPFFRPPFIFLIFKIQWIFRVLHRYIVILVLIVFVLIAGIMFGYSDRSAGRRFKASAGTTRGCTM